jgi:hypothetical protein
LLALECLALLERYTRRIPALVGRARERGALQDCAHSLVAAAVTMVQAANAARAPSAAAALVATFGASGGVAEPQQQQETQQQTQQQTQQGDGDPPGAGTGAKPSEAPAGPPGGDGEARALASL